MVCLRNNVTARVLESFLGRFNGTFVYRGNISTHLSFLVVSTAKARTVGDQSVFIAVAAARKVNKMHLTFFLLFWTEHILERSRLKSDDVEKAVLKLTTPSPSAAPNPALPAPPSTLILAPRCGGPYRSRHRFPSTPHCRLTLRLCRRRLLFAHTVPIPLRSPSRLLANRYSPSS
jgi:hypothetical protein